jgi:hypothetical protein
VVLSANINYLSDNSFHRDYLSEEWVQVASTLKTAVGTSYNYKNHSAYILFEREDYWNDNEKKYHLKNLSLPKMAFSTQLNQIYKLPLFYSLTAEIKNNYSASSINQFLLNFSGSLLYRKLITRQLYTTLSISSNCSYEPKKENIYGNKKLNLSNTFSLSAKYSLSNNIELNTIYNFDHTISSATTNNNITFNIQTYHKNIELISGTKYNFLTKNYDTLYMDASCNVQPLHSTAKLLLNYNFSNNKLSYLSFETKHGKTSDNCITLSLSYPFTGNVLNTKFNIRVRAKNNISFYLIHWGNLYFYEKRYTPTATDAGLEKDLHCWLGKLYLRQRGTNYEGWVTFEIKSHIMETTRNYILEKEKEWYPYREKWLPSEIVK